MVTETSGSAQARILIVDDNVEFRESAADILELAGYEDVHAVGREEAVERLHREPVDLLLLDLGLDRAGLGILEGVRPVPIVVAISGLDEEPGDPRITTFLTKPIDPERLLAEVSSRLTPEG